MSLSAPSGNVSPYIELHAIVDHGKASIEVVGVCMRVRVSVSF